MFLANLFGLATDPGSPEETAVDEQILKPRFGFGEQNNVPTTEIAKQMTEPPKLELSNIYEGIFRLVNRKAH